ncbi:MAG: hypothetical protein J6V53_04835 [Alphaproteobacteria bacterium]|nr:hypothetical protein [Alphaproteobacteria bacterium]
MKVFFVFVSLLFVTACAQFDPFVDARREAGQKEMIGSSKPNAPVVCSGLFTDQSERQALADAECKKVGKKAVSQQISSFECKLFLPVKERFVCVED